MELTNEFRLSLPVDHAWPILLDVERIAPCLPGTDLHEVEGDEYRGLVKVKVGPISAQYEGTATFVERDHAGHRLVLRAEGRDTRGQGNAVAVITAVLNADGGGTRVNVVTDLAITGKVAQFGRTVLADVGDRWVEQFLECLETTVLAGNGQAEATVGAEPSPPASLDEGAPSSNGAAVVGGIMAEPATAELPGEDLRTVDLALEEALAAERPVEERVAAERPAEETPPPVHVGEEERAPATELPTRRPEPPPAPSVAPRPIPPRPAGPIDRAAKSGAAVARRVGPVLAVVVVLYLLRRWRGRR